MIHITGAFLFLGGAVAASVLNVLALRSERPSEAALLLGLIKVTVIVMGVGIATTLILGIWLWHHDGYALGTVWLWASVALWILANVLGDRGGRHQERTRKLAQQLAATGDATTDELRGLLRDRRGNAMSWLAGAASLAILVLMIWKPS